MARNKCVLHIVLVIQFIVSFVNSKNDSFIKQIEMINDLISYEYHGMDVVGKIVQLSCTPSDGKSIFKQSKEHTSYRLVLSKPSDEDFRSLFISSGTSKIFVVDLSCNETFINKIPLLQQQIGIFSLQNKWIFINGPSSDVEEHFELFDGLEMYLDSDITICLQSNQENERIYYDLYKIFKYRIDSLFNSIQFAAWDEGIIEKNQLVLHRTNNLNGNVLKACLVLSNPDSQNHLDDKRFKRIDTYAKINYPLLEAFEYMFNASMEYIFVGDWQRSYNESRNDGMLAKLINKEADLGAYPLLISEEHLKNIDFATLSVPGTAKFVFRQPKLSYMTNVYTLPFARSVWVSSFGLVVLLTCVMYMVTKWQWHIEKRTAEDKLENELVDSFSDVAFMSVGAICQQGSDVIPNNMHGRIVMLLLFISLMFLYTSYSANIVALLQSSSSSIQTLDDLRVSPLEVGVQNSSDFLTVVPDVQGPERQSLYRHKINVSGEKGHFVSLEEGVAKFRKDLYAFYMDTGFGYTVVEETFEEEEKCGLQEMEFLQFKTDLFLPISKKSPYSQVFKTGFTKLYENGVHNREISRMLTKKPQCVTGDSSFVSIGLTDCYFAVALLTGGLATSLLMFLGEVMFSKTNWKRAFMAERKLLI